MTKTASAILDGQQWPTLEFYYTNHKMETEHRRARPIAFWFGSTKYHQGEQCFMEAMDLDKTEFRNFAVRDMRDVRTAKREREDTAGDAIVDALHAIKQGHRDIAVEYLERAIAALG